MKTLKIYLLNCKAKYLAMKNDIKKKAGKNMPTDPRKIMPIINTILVFLYLWYLVQHVVHLVVHRQRVGSL